MSRWFVLVGLVVVVGGAGCGGNSANEPATPPDVLSPENPAANKTGPPDLSILKARHEEEVGRRGGKK